MLLIIGFLIVLGATLGGFMIAGGQPVVLLHVSEFVVIGGIALGILVVSCPFSTIKSMMGKIAGAMGAGVPKKEDYVDLLKLQYELFMLARRDGLIALEDHMVDPANSAIMQKYPSFSKKPDRVKFLCDGLKPLIDGRVKPEQVDGLYHAEIDAKEEEAEAPVHILQLIGDSLPGVGIIAAVLGIINTMAAISDGPEAVGERVAAALTGTFLGILGAYGFINPLTNRIKINNMVDLQYYNSIRKGVSGFANGVAPIMAVEFARRALDRHSQPDADELEKTLKSLNVNKAA